MPRKKGKKKNVEKIKYEKTKNGRYFKRLPSGRCRFVSKAEAESQSTGSGGSSDTKTLKTKDASHGKPKKPSLRLKVNKKQKASDTTDT